MELPPWMLEHSRKVTKVVVEVLARALRTRHAITVGDEVISRRIARNLVEEHTGPILVPRPNPNRKERAKVGKVKTETKRLSMLLRTTTRRSTMMRKSKNSQRMRKDLGAMFVCALSKQRVGSNGETVIDIGIDSCAAASVIPRGLLQLPVRRDGRGGTYYTATKEPISDEGLQIVEGRAHGDGTTLVGRFRVAPVSRTLMSLSQMVEQGIRVVFDSTAGKDSSHMVIKKCGVKIPLVKRNKVYVLPWHVKGTSDFSRRGQNL